MDIQICISAFLVTLMPGDSYWFLTLDFTFDDAPSPQVGKVKLERDTGIIRDTCFLKKSDFHRRHTWSLLGRFITWLPESTASVGFCPPLLIGGCGSHRGEWQPFQSDSTRYLGERHCKEVLCGFWSMEMFFFSIYSHVGFSGGLYMVLLNICIFTFWNNCDFINSCLKVAQELKVLLDSTLLQLWPAYLI